MYEKQGYLKEEFRIFHIKDRQERSFSFHYHDFYKVVILLDGKVTYTVEGKNYELLPKDIVLVGKNDIHRPVVDALCDYERIVLYLSQSFLSLDNNLLKCFEKAKEEHTNVMRLQNIDFEKVIELIYSAIALSNSESFASDTLSRLRMMEALLILGKSLFEKGFLSRGEVSFDSKIIEVCEYISTHLMEELDIDALSETFFISKYYLMHKFKDYTGETIHRYILEKRILLTKQYVEKGEKVTKACLLAGFKDYSTYLRAMKRLSGRLSAGLDEE